MKNTKHTALIVGGNGIIGKNLGQYLQEQEEWNVVITSRSTLTYETKAAFVAMDLSKSNAVKKHAKKLKEVTHIFYAAYSEKQDPYEQTEANLSLLTNLVDKVEDYLPKLERILFIQGGKAYGAHLGFYKTPAYETDLRSITPNFYYDQEDYLRTISKGKSWNWTAIRPDIVMGFTIKNPMNMANLLSVYASLCKEEGIPMRFPGSAKAYEILANVTHVDVLSKAMQWAAENKETENEIFNITNGDVFRWSQLWPKIGEFFGVSVAEPQTFALNEYMPGKKDLWKKMVKKYGLKAYELDELVQWGFGDFIFNVETDAFQDVNKARRFGFHEMNGDTETKLINTFKELQTEKIIPTFE
ncbi:SDR family oxidoreductase [Neptunitalea lumnitzerae]|uniref:NAD-dependent dehydratase n=1 Tax=Neptunitalea lumnitzerae TaxID=2965509 RepID=A0ABQ5MIP2_9FLAO|nr:SDR family oxidoreductase [Neptunitalea sp. Y10]GLB49277.1 NAD-dependent dehydratase [Neptunitalea sp. Y10]